MTKKIASNTTKPLIHYLFFRLWTLDLVAKFFLYGFLLWAVLKYTGLNEYIYNNDTQAFVKEI